MAVKQIDPKRFEAEVSRSELPVLLEFYASWCPRCAMMEDVLEQFAAEQSSRIKVYSMEEEQAAQLMDYYGVDRVPAFLAFYNGKVTGVIVGGTSKEALESMFRRK